MINIPQPAADEFAPYYATYINATQRELTEGGVDLKFLLASQPERLASQLSGVDPSLASYSYAPGKWTLAESIVHMCDAERVFSYRLLRIARGDTTPLPSFDQDAWVPESRSAMRPLDSVVGEFQAIRRATVCLVDSLDSVALSRSGTASDKTVSSRALVWIIAGHASHHLRIISERYLAQPVQR